MPPLAYRSYGRSVNPAIFTTLLALAGLAAYLIYATN